MSTNLFDNIQATAYGVVTNTMGYDATWTPSAGGAQQTARVLLNKPTQKDNISDQEYDALSAKVEYKLNDFEGLYESVRTGNNETVTINTIAYAVYRAELKHDGKTILLSVQPPQ